MPAVDYVQFIPQWPLCVELLAFNHGRQSPAVVGVAESQAAIVKKRDKAFYLSPKPRPRLDEEG